MLLFTFWELGLIQVEKWAMWFSFIVQVSIYIYIYIATICSLLEKYYVLIGKWFFILSLQKASYIKIKVDAKDIKQLVTRRCWWHGFFFSPQINLTQLFFNIRSSNECCEEVFCDILDDPNRFDITEKFNSIIFIMIFSISRCVDLFH